MRLQFGLHCKNKYPGLLCKTGPYNSYNIDYIIDYINCKIVKKKKAPLFKKNRFNFPNTVVYLMRRKQKTAMILSQ